MPVMTGRNSIAANATSANLLAGLIAEFLSQPAVVRLYATGGAVGLNAQLLVGEEVAIDDMEVSSANRSPVIPEDFLAEAGALGSERLILRARNTTGAAIIFFWMVQVEPI